MDKEKEIISVVDSDITALMEKKKENLQFTNKSAYIKEKVFEFKDKWWKALDEMMNSEEKDERRTALIEYNKLQCRVLPTEITGADGDQLVLNVIGYGVKNNLLPEKEGDSSIIDGEVK